MDKFTNHPFIDTRAEGAVKREVLPLANRANPFGNLHSSDLPSADSTDGRSVSFNPLPAIKTEQIVYGIIFKGLMAD